jgi:hypothetical protein
MQYFHNMTHFERSKLKLKASVPFVEPLLMGLKCFFYSPTLEGSLSAQPRPRLCPSTHQNVKNVVSAD